MSEQLEVTTSLAGMASKKGKSVRADATVDTANRRDAVKRDGFDGFLKTFLGKEQTQGGSLSASRDRSAKQSAGRNRSARQNAGKERDSLVSALGDRKKNTGRKGQAGAGNAASKLSARDKAGLKKALGKTVPAESAGDAPAEFARPPNSIRWSADSRK